MLYANPKYDVSDEVLDNLGASMSGRKGKNPPSGVQKGGDTGIKEGKTGDTGIKERKK
jgi:hypothetical protein